MSEELQGFLDFLATAKNGSTSGNDGSSDGDMPPLANVSFSSILTDLQSRLGDGRVIQREGPQADPLRGFLDVLAAATNGVPTEQDQFVSHRCRETE